jgi:phospholipid transport system substrate-binding protein
MRLPPLVLGFFTAVAAMLALDPASGAASADPSAFVIAFGSQINRVLEDRSLTPTERRQRFGDVLVQGLDFPRISCFVLGSYWQGSNDSYRLQFIGVFEQFLTQTLLSRFSAYSSDTLYVTGTRPEGENSILVMTLVLYPNGEPHEELDWRLRNARGGFEIEDVSDSGVSLAQLYRDDFAGIITRDGGQVAGLIPEMQEKLDKPAIKPVAGTKPDQDRNVPVSDCAI